MTRPTTPAEALAAALAQRFDYGNPAIGGLSPVTDADHILAHLHPDFSIVDVETVARRLHDQWCAGRTWKSGDHDFEARRLLAPSSSVEEER